MPRSSSFQLRPGEGRVRPQLAAHDDLDFGLRLRRRRPADPCRTTKIGLNDQAMKRGNEENIEATQAIVAMNNGRYGQVTFSSRRRLGGTQNRESEVQVLVIFSQNNFSWTCAVELKDAESARSLLRIQ